MKITNWHVHKRWIRKTVIMMRLQTNRQRQAEFAERDDECRKQAINDSSVSSLFPLFLFIIRCVGGHPQRSLVINVIISHRRASTRILRNIIIQIDTVYSHIYCRLHEPKKPNPAVATYRLGHRADIVYMFFLCIGLPWFRETDKKITRKEYTLDWSQSKVFLVYYYYTLIRQKTA